MRFVGIGIWNTVFSYVVFAMMYHLFGGGWRDIIVQIVAGIIGITNAFVLHKVFTYRSHGVWWREYLRFYVVYGTQVLFQTVLFLIFATKVGWNGYAVQFVVTICCTILSYWAHNRYSFQQAKNKGVSS